MILLIPTKAKASLITTVHPAPAFKTKYPRKPNLYSNVKLAGVKWDIRENRERRNIERRKIPVFSAQCEQSLCPDSPRLSQSTRVDSS